MTDSYRIFAMRYAHRDLDSSEVFLGDHERTPMGMDYFVWAVTDGTRTVVVDLGFTESVGTARGRTFLRHPAEGLAAVGIDPPTVEHVVVTHFHYDHTGHHALFPQARFYIQDREMAFYTGRFAPEPAFHRSIEPDDVAAFVRMNYEGRVHFVDGEHEVLPGVRLHHVGGHTAGMQIVSVQTERGRAVLTSDASHYYRNYLEGIPFQTLHDIPGCYRAFAQIRELADAPDLIVPGHDPLVLQRLTAVSDGIVRL
jgi:glyoxylase-like metal-dependent hydrolase (beta-lactamase superfamily II)